MIFGPKLAPEPREIGGVAATPLHLARLPDVTLIRVKVLNLRAISLRTLANIWGYLKPSIGQLFFVEVLSKMPLLGQQDFEKSMTASLKSLVICNHFLMRPSFAKPRSRIR